MAQEQVQKQHTKTDEDKQVTQHPAPPSADRHRGDMARARRAAARRRRQGTQHDR